MVVTFDQINSILPELLVQGIDPANVYLVDGNAVSFADVVDAGSVVGMTASIPGAQAKDEFQGQLKDIYKAEFGEELTSFTYGPEAYDLVTIVALATEKAGTSKPAEIQKNIAAVTGADGGTECTTYAECKDLIADGKDITYVGKAGTGPLNENNDPSAAEIGIFKYNDKNELEFVESVRGES